MGIGNTLAGDDGLGIEAIRRLQQRWPARSGLLLATLEGDLFAVEEILPEADHIIFIDALSGDPPGEVCRKGPTTRAFAPSLHQLDVATVMTTLARLSAGGRFPTWEVWGVTISPPRELGEGLSPPVERALAMLLGQLDEHVERLLPER